MICIRMRFKWTDVKWKFESQRKLIDCRRLWTAHTAALGLSDNPPNESDWRETKFEVLKNSWQSRLPSIRCLLTVCLAFPTFLNLLNHTGDFPIFHRTNTASAEKLFSLAMKKISQANCVDSSMNEREHEILVGVLNWLIIFSCENNQHSFTWLA